jgi:fumarate reductase subunit C
MAVQGGLTAGEILARTHGSVMWAAFYGLFVLAAGIHAGIGLQTILGEWTPLGRVAAASVGHTLITILWLLGARAIYAVVWA